MVVEVCRVSTDHLAERAKSIGREKSAAGGIWWRRQRPWA
jgi:hypothetical protein